MMIRLLGIANQWPPGQDATVTSAANLQPDLSYANSAAFDAARAICRAHAKSFYFASMFLPSAKRNAAYAVYAFCRLLDDATDEATDSTEIARQIDRFVALLDEVYSFSFSGRPEAAPGQNSKSEIMPDSSTAHPVSDFGFRIFKSSPSRQPLNDELALIAFAATVHQYDIPKSCFVEIAEGCRMDLTISRYETWEDLRKYCYRVAGVVGVIMSRVFGLADPSAEAQAIMMGEAMQLTNILRDIKEDAGRGRIYLPLEDLARFGYTEADLLAGVVNEPFRNLMKFEIQRSRSLFRAGAAGLPHLQNDGSRFTATAMGVIYAGILKAIEKQNYDVFSNRARLTLAQKLLRLPAARRVCRGGDPAGAF